MVILWDYESYNAGFLAVKASSRTIQVYDLVQTLTNQSSTLDDQRALNAVLQEVSMRRGIDIKVMNKSRQVLQRLSHEVTLVENII